MIKNIKKEFYALRNGIVADALRKAGMHYTVIFGLHIPQIAEIAKQYANCPQLAEDLWNDKNVRESRILATYLFPLESVNMEKALALAADISTPEEADMLAFRIFKRLSFAHQLLAEMERPENNIPSSAIASLKRHLL